MKEQEKTPEKINKIKFTKEFKTKAKRIQQYQIYSEINTGSASTNKKEVRRYRVEEIRTGRGEREERR